MTLDEKLEQFYNATIESATQQNLKITGDYKDSLAKILEDHKKDTLQKSEVTYQLESENLIREKNRTLSSASINIKRKLNEKSSQLIDALFLDVKKKLEEFMKTEEYTSLLIKQILKAKEFARNDEVIIYINSSDSYLKEMLEQKTKVTLTISASDFIGGTRSVIHEKNILIDHSFSSKILEVKESFTL
jgi:V/A-type H+-transporting ATPase subunit E